MEKLADAGIFGNWYFRNWDSFKADNFNVRRIEKSALPKIEVMKTYFNWTSTLINSEVCAENKMLELKENPGLMRTTTEKLGFTPPLDEIKFAPTRCSWSDDSQKDENGVYTPGKAFKTLWWYEIHRS